VNKKTGAANFSSTNKSVYLVSNLKIPVFKDKVVELRATPGAVREQRS
jgi:hypothetical protein